VSDLLSFAGETRGDPPPLAPDYPSDFVLTERFHSSLQQLVPAGFNISPLPNEISCFVIQVLQTLELSLTPNKNPPTRTKTESGVDAIYIASVSVRFRVERDQLTVSRRRVHVFHRVP
jgi:hypothetical protein